MNESEFDIIKSGVFLFYIFSFAIAAWVVKSKKIQGDFKNFLVYLFVGAFIALFYLTTIFFEKKHNMVFFNRVNLISLFFHFVFLSLFILKIITIYKHEKIILFIFCFILLASIIKDFYNNTSALSFCVGSFFLEVFCLFYYYNIFHSPPTVKLFDEPSFLIITGIFIGMTLSLPMIIFWDFLDLNLTRPTKRLIQAFGNIPYMIMHIFFIKAYICLLHKPKKLSYS